MSRMTNRQKKARTVGAVIISILIAGVTFAIMFIGKIGIFKEMQPEKANKTPTCTALPARSSLEAAKSLAKKALGLGTAIGGPALLHQFATTKSADKNGAQTANVMEDVSAIPFLADGWNTQEIDKLLAPLRKLAPGDAYVSWRFGLVLDHGSGAPHVNSKSTMAIYKDDTPNANGDIVYIYKEIPAEDQTWKEEPLFRMKGLSVFVAKKHT